MAINMKNLRNIMRTDDGVNGDAQRLEQTVWMLFMKLFDSKEDEWEIKAKLKGQPYESSIPDKYRWKNWALDERGMTGDELIEFVETMFKELKQLPVNNVRDQIVHDVFADTHNYMKSGTILRQVINEINKTDFNINKERHDFNDIYESMLLEMQSAGDSGEFYTPRPVTEFVVEMVDPKVNERILDFACGTGGFLTCAIEHFENTNQINGADDVEKIQKNIQGIEKKQLPYALCMTNLLLHGIDIPNIEHRNSLTGEVSGFSDSKQVDIIVTNPPYGGIEEDGVSSNFAKEFQTKETADLFMALLMEKLSDNGRAGIVLPDSILFGDGVKNNIKAKLLKEFNLHTIVRLPEGVFAPYTSITTNLLFFNRNPKGTKEIWFYELELPEGQARFTKTNPIKRQHFDKVKAWWNNRVENKQAWLVKVEDLDNYNLDLKNPNTEKNVNTLSLDELKMQLEDSYKQSNDIFLNIINELNCDSLFELSDDESHDSSKHKSLSEIGKLLSGKTPKPSETSDNGEIPYYKVSDMNVIGNEVEMKVDSLFLKTSNYTLFPKNSIIFPKNGGALLTNKKRILTKDSLVDLNTGVFVPNKDMYYKYIYYMFESLDFRNHYKGTALPTLDKDSLFKLKFYVPSYEEQVKIANKLDKLVDMMKEKDKIDEHITEMKTALRNKAVVTALKITNE